MNYPFKDFKRIRIWLSLNFLNTMCVYDDQCFQYQRYRNQKHESIKHFFQSFYYEMKFSTQGRQKFAKFPKNPLVLLYNWVLISRSDYDWNLSPLRIKTFWLGIWCSGRNKTNSKPFKKVFKYKTISNVYWTVLSSDPQFSQLTQEKSL